MKIKKLGLCCLQTSLMLYGCLFGQGSVFATIEESQPAQVMVDIYDPPVPFEALDKMYMAYELYLTNFYNTDITLDAIQVHDKDTETPLLGFDKNALRKMVRKTCVDNTNTPCNELLIPAGGMKLVYLLLPFNSPNDVPKEMFQKIFITKKDDNTQAELKTLPLKLNKPMTVMVRPPVRGDYWVAMNGMAAMSPHRTAHTVMNGQNYFAQRYAVDFMQIDLDGKSFQGSENENGSYYAYGKDVFAVARGTVVAMKDGIQDNKPQLSAGDTNTKGIKGNVEKTSAENVSGNYVVLELGKGLYAFYAHLRPGSIKVKMGEKVAEGQMLGQIGNSGDSKIPHLHFHIVDRPAYFAGNAIPYTFTEFWFRPSEIVENGTQKMFKFNETPNGLKRYTNQALLENVVVKFNEEGRIPKERKTALSAGEEDDDVGAVIPKTPIGNPNATKANSKAGIIREENFRQPSVRLDPNNPNNSNNRNGSYGANGSNGSNGSYGPHGSNSPNMQRQPSQTMRSDPNNPNNSNNPNNPNSNANIQRQQSPTYRSDSANPNGPSNGSNMTRQQNSRAAGNGNARSNRASNADAQRQRSNREPAIFQGLRSIFGME